MESLKSLTVHKGKEKPWPSPESSFIPSLKSNMIFIPKIRQICYEIKGKILLSFKSKTKDIKNTKFAAGCFRLQSDSYSLGGSHVPGIVMNSQL